MTLMYPKQCDDGRRLRLLTEGWDYVAEAVLPAERPLVTQSHAFTRTG